MEIQSAFPGDGIAMVDPLRMPRSWTSRTQLRHHLELLSRHPSCVLKDQPLLGLLGPAPELRQGHQDQGRQRLQKSTQEG